MFSISVLQSRGEENTGYPFVCLFVCLSLFIVFIDFLGCILFIYFLFFIFPFKVLIFKFLFVVYLLFVCLHYIGVRKVQVVVRRALEFMRDCNEYVRKAKELMKWIEVQESIFRNIEYFKDSEIEELASLLGS